MPGNDLARQIKERLTTRQVVELYGFHPDRGGYIQCPFHTGDNHGSLKVYDGSKTGWHCFGCGAGGSVIDFVMRLFGLSFAQACLKLNCDFGLGLTGERPSMAERSALLEARRREAQEKEAAAALYREKAAEYRQLWEAQKFLSPDTVFSKIIFQRDLRWGVKNGYLCDIHCRRVDIGFDITAVHTRRGDYAPGELDQAMDGTADAIAQAYRDMAVGATLIFAVSVHQAEEIAKRIQGAVVVTGETKNRSAIIDAFTAGEIPCIVNCMVFTEGTDIPRVETVIVARPTQSESLYAQMVGRGLRLYPGKQRLELIDCVGITGKASLCTAPSLLGIDMDNVPKRKEKDIEGDLFELPEKIEVASDSPESWVKNIHLVDLWAQEMKYQTHDVNWFKMPDGSLVCSLANKQRMTIPCPDALGMVNLPNGSRCGMQEALDRAYLTLIRDHQNDRMLWDLQAVRKWGKSPATAKQLEIIEKHCKGFDIANLSKGDASQILNRLFNAPKKRRGT